MRRLSGQCSVHRGKWEVLSAQGSHRENGKYMISIEL